MPDLIENFRSAQQRYNSFYEADKVHLSFVHSEI